MNNTECKTETEEELKDRLLAEYRKKQEEEELQEECRKSLLDRKRWRYTKMYDFLKVPYTDVIIIRDLDFKRSIVHAYDRVFDFKYLSDYGNDYYVKEHDFTYIESRSRSLEERVNNFGNKNYFSRDINELNNYGAYYIRNDRKFHIFYMNSATLCPFCGDLTPNENEEYVGDIFSESCLSNLRSQAVFYKRCCDHKKMSRKDYLHSWKAVTKKTFWGKVEKSYLEILQESVYPSPIKHDRGYFKNKKEKTNKAPKEKTKKSFNYKSPKDITSGNVYLMKNGLNGRIKIGRTKNKPVYRERTLQSQEPEVNLIFYRKVSDMSETERYLHTLFASKRFRGEWFDLSKEDVEEAKSIIEKASSRSLGKK